MPALRRAVRLRGAIPEVSARALPRAGSAGRAEAPRLARTVRRVRWLTRRGAAAALAVGVATLWGFGWRGLILLLAFFVSSSLLTAAAKKSAAKGGEESGGGGRRNARQVVANGGIAAVAALAGNWAWFAGALAAANADTWATEIGS